MSLWNSIRPRSTIAVFLFRVAIIYGLLSVPWRGFTDSYNDQVRQVIRAVYGADDQRHTITVDPSTDDPEHPYNSRITIVNCALMNPDGSGPIRNVDFDTTGIAPVGLLFALIVATPVSWARRGRALLWAIPSAYLIGLLFVGFCIWDESSEISLITFTPVQKEIVQIVRDLLTSQLSLSAPVFLWIVTTFRAEDFIGRFSLERRITNSPAPA